jgi:hypothetical protein
MSRFGDPPGVSRQSCRPQGSLHLTRSRGAAGTIRVGSAVTFAGVYFTGSRARSACTWTRCTCSPRSSPGGHHADRSGDRPGGGQAGAGSGRRCSGGPGQRGRRARGAAGDAAVRACGGRSRRARSGARCRGDCRRAGPRSGAGARRGVGVAAVGGVGELAEVVLLGEGGGGGILPALAEVGPAGGGDAVGVEVAGGVGAGAGVAGGLAGAGAAGAVAVLDRESGAPHRITIRRRRYAMCAAGTSPLSAQGNDGAGQARMGRPDHREAHPP